MQENREDLSLEERIEKSTRRILRMLCAYTAFITLLRLTGRGMYALGIVEGLIFPEPVYGPTPLGGMLFCLLPIAIAAYASRTRLNERARYFTAAFAWCVLLNHLVLLPISILGIGLSESRNPVVVYSVLASQTLIPVYMFFLLGYCRRLGKLRRERDEPVDSTQDFGLFFVGMFAAFILCALLRVTPYQIWDKASLASHQLWNKIRFSSFAPAAKDVLVITSDDCTVLPSTALSVRVSPDGKLLAMGGEKELTVWDAESREMLLKDETISCRSVRFSASGKYLAAVGTATSKDLSCVVL